MKIDFTPSAICLASITLLRSSSSLTEIDLFHMANSSVLLLAVIEIWEARSWALRTLALTSETEKKFLINNGTLLQLDIFIILYLFLQQNCIELVLCTLCRLKNQDNVDQMVIYNNKNILNMNSCTIALVLQKNTIKK